MFMNYKIEKNMIAQICQPPGLDVYATACDPPVRHLGFVVMHPGTASYVLNIVSNFSRWFAFSEIRRFSCFRIGLNWPFFTFWG